MLLARLSAGFQSLPPLPTSKLSLSGADSQVSGFVYSLRPCGSLQRPLLWSWEFLPLQCSFEAICPCAGTLSCTVCLTPQSFLPVYLHANVGPPSLPNITSPAQSSSCHFAGSPFCPSCPSPPLLPNECFFFNSLVVGLPYGLIFWLFWLFFVFKFVVVVLLVVQGGTVYLRMPPSWLEAPIN